MPKNTPDLPEIFSAALAIHDDSERSRLIDRLADGRQEMREQVYELLKAHESANSFLSTPPQELELTHAPIQQKELSNLSVMKSLKSEYSVSPVILRNETADEIEPIIRPGSNEIPTQARGTKYQFQGEIARGGMGAILQGRDTDIGRSLAIKVLLDDHKDNPQIVQRFVEEAQIGGQLQHPGIAPVYELGQFEDHRPFFTMKLVKGKTLAALLTKRKHVFERGKLLGIFEQICQTVAYAHSRGVIHRDLKPANIMVGAFGEVQVMDWGLAKVLESGGTADENKALQEQTAHSVINTFRSGGSGPAMIGTDPANAGETLAGSVMGTPAYMPPEQARGEIDRLDERCDVFGLGAILCEILTGRPPYFDDSREIIYQALEGNLVNAFNNLDECQADTELVEIAKACLAPNPTNRIPDAQVLAERFSAYLEGVEEKLHEAELARAKETARAIEARKRQRVTIALAASILFTFGMGTAAWIWNQNQKNQRRATATQKVNEAIGEARLQLGLADSADPFERLVGLEKALASANIADEIAQDSLIDHSLKASANELLVNLQQEIDKTEQRAKLAEADRQLKDKLEFIRLSHADGNQAIVVKSNMPGVNFNVLGTRQKYLNAFRKAGHDFSRQSNAELVAWIQQSEIRETIISAIDHWTQCLPTDSEFESRYPWTAAKSWEEAAQIAKANRDQNPGRSLLWMFYGATLVKAEDEIAYREFCQEMLDKFKGNRDELVQERLCKMCLFLPGMVDPEILPDRWVSRLKQYEQYTPPNRKNWVPFAWNARGLLELRKGNWELALEMVQKSQSFDPPLFGQSLNYCVQAMAHSNLGDAKSAKASLQEAVTSLRQSFRTGTNYHHDHIFARILIQEAADLIQPDEEIAAFPLDRFPRKASEAGQYSIKSKRGVSAIDSRLISIANSADTSELRKSVRSALFKNDLTFLRNVTRNPGLLEHPPEILAAVAAALREAKEIETAEAMLRKAQRQHPGDFWLNYELAMCLLSQQNYEEGIGFSRGALAARPGSVGAMWLVTSALADGGRHRDSLEQFKILLIQGGLSVTECRELSRQLLSAGRWEAAELAIKRARELAPNRPVLAAWHARILSNLGRGEEALEILERNATQGPAGIPGHYQRAQILWELGRTAEAIDLLERIADRDLQSKPEVLQALVHSALGNFLVEAGNFTDAEAHHQKAAELFPKSVTYRPLQIFEQFAKGERKEALRAIEAFVEKRGSVTAYALWAEMLIYEANENGEFPNARRAVELATQAVGDGSYQLFTALFANVPSPYTVLGMAQFRAGDNEAAIKSLEQAQKFGRQNPKVWLYLAMANCESDREKANEYLTKSETWLANATGELPRLNKLLAEARQVLRQADKN